MPKGFLKKIKRESDIGNYRFRYNNIYESYLAIADMFDKRESLDAEEFVKDFELEMRGFYNIITIIHKDGEGKEITLKVVNIFAARRRTDGEVYLFLFDIERMLFYIAPAHNYVEDDVIKKTVESAKISNFTSLDPLKGTYHYNGYLMSFDMMDGINFIGKRQIFNVLIYYSVNNSLKLINDLTNDIVNDGVKAIFEKKISNKVSFQEMVLFLSSIQSIISNNQEMENSMAILLSLVDRLS